MSTKRFTANVQLRVGTKVPTANGFRTDYADVPHALGLELDLDRLFRDLGHRAQKSKSGRATALHGAIVVTAKRI